MTEIIDQLTSSNRLLFLTLVVLYIVWHFGAKIVGERPLYDHFPRFSALVDVLVYPLLLLVTGALVRAFLAHSGLSQFDAAVRTLTLLLAHLALGWTLGALVNVFIRTKGGDDDARVQMPNLVVGLIYIFFMLLTLGLYMRNQGYDFEGVWLSTGVAAAVLGLALQSTLTDLFSGIAMGLEAPFRIGDWLELEDGTVGQVIDMNWRATRLRAWNNTTHIIPNGKLAKEKFNNLHDTHHLYSPWYFVKIPAEVDPRFATALLLEAATRCPTVLQFPNPVVRLADATGVPYSYMVWVHLPNYPAVFRGREELFREIHQSLIQAGIQVAPEITEFRTRRAPVTNAEPPTVELALRGLDFADILTEAEFDLIAANSDYRYYDTGQVILAEGEFSDAVFVVAGGLVENQVRLPDGRFKVVETLGPGSYFGIVSMLDLNVSTLEHRASTDVTLIRVDLETVKSVVNARPELAEQLVKVIKERLDFAESVRARVQPLARRLTLRDIQAQMHRKLFGRG